MQAILFSFILSQFLASCGITYRVRNTKNELEELLYFPCGNVTVELEGRGDSKFVIKQKFIATGKIALFVDSVSIIYNGRALKHDNVSVDGARRSSVTEINGNENIEFSFELEMGVFDGDTIGIYAPNFIRCMDDFITLDTVFYTFSNRLRIYGVNAL